MAKATAATAELIKIYKDEAVLPEGVPLATPEQLAHAYGSYYGVLPTSTRPLMMT